MNTQHFLTLDDLSTKTLQSIIDRAIDLKSLQNDGAIYEPLKNQSLAMIFNKASTRTRVSFEVAMQQLGGTSINLNPSETQIGRGEVIKDTARVISSMVDGIMIRTDSHAKLEEFASYSTVPVINGLTDDYHPCQLLADLQTVQELRGSAVGCTMAWIGDGNNVCHSFMNAARLFGFELQIATPIGYEPSSEVVARNNSSIRLSNDPREAASNADVIITDTWSSMGQEDEKNERNNAFTGFCVDQALMRLAKKDAIFLHCLPAYRGCEVSEEVIEGPQSAVFQEAENRLHAQKALLEFLMKG
jgi:ornithine carbamoyltransferase